ncbi:MAG: sugar phosphate isomerase/epimerase [Phycisphaerales bacterium]|nr:sugar phosphate isomerase/epimerase [Phycisphaerales bacterium]
MAPPRPVTLFTGQWADLPLERLAAMAGKTNGGFGYDGLELACWGDPPHFDVQAAVGKDGSAYCRGRHGLLAEHGGGMKVWAISNHLVGQCVCDHIDKRHRSIIPARLWGDGEAEGVRKRCAQEMIDTARAAARLGVSVVNGFTGSSIWGNLYFFPPTSQEDVEAGFNDFAERWGPILDAFGTEGVRFALEVHPSEIAYDIHTARRALSAVGGHKAFGFNFDPSHLHWQFVDPVAFIRAFPDRIFHCHVKDAARTPGERRGCWGRTCRSVTRGGGGTSARRGGAGWTLRRSSAR